MPRNCKRVILDSREIFPILEPTRNFVQNFICERQYPKKTLLYSNTNIKIKKTPWPREKSLFPPISRDI